MSFDWLKNFQQDMDKPPDYAQKTLAAYKLGMKAKGSIAGVRITIDPQGCEASRQIDSKAVYHPDQAPHIPLQSCSKKKTCGCIYRPVMTYQLDDMEE